MANRKNKPPSLKAMARAANKITHLTAEELMRRYEELKTVEGPPQFNLQQKVVALKILQFNGMDVIHTSKVLGITRQTMAKWRDTMGDVVFLARPEIAIAEKIEVDILKIRASVEEDAYNLIKTGLKRLNAMVDTCTNPRQIYLAAEAVRASIEVLQTIDDFQRQKDGPPQNNFFTGILNNFINADNNGNKDRSLGDITEAIEP